jgi:invasion protein IalB
LHDRFGAWEIRCGQAGARRRCALALETVMAASLDPETRPLRLLSHVVIDSVAGRESVIWRVHVIRDLGVVEGGIGVQMAARRLVERFDVCSRRGCIAEAEPEVGAEVASALSLGRPVAISLESRDRGEPIVGMLPAYGFRQGIAELIRLRRSELKPLAEH